MTGAPTIPVKCNHLVLSAQSRSITGRTLVEPLAVRWRFLTCISPAKKKTFFFFSEEFRLEKTPTEYNQAVPSLKERGLIMTSQGIRKNLVPGLGGTVYQDFDFTDICPLPGTTGPIASQGFSRTQFPDCPSLPSIGIPSNMLPPLNHLSLPSPGSGLTSGTGVDKNALSMLTSNLIPLPNSPVGCDYTVANPDPTDPNHCYDAAISPPTYWREELFRVDHDLTSTMRAVVPLHSRFVEHDCPGATVEYSANHESVRGHLSHGAKPFCGPWYKLGSKGDRHRLAHPAQ